MPAPASANPLHHRMLGGRSHSVHDLGRVPTRCAASAQGQVHLIHHADALDREAGSTTNAMDRAGGIEPLEGTQAQRHLRGLLQGLRGQYDSSESGGFRNSLSDLLDISSGGAEVGAVATSIKVPTNPCFTSLNVVDIPWPVDSHVERSGSSRRSADIVTRTVFIDSAVHDYLGNRLGRIALLRLCGNCQ